MITTKKIAGLLIAVVCTQLPLAADDEHGATLLLPSRKPSTEAEAKKETEKGIQTPRSEGIPFISNDTYLSDPSSLLGSVLVLRKTDSSSTLEKPIFEFSGFQNITRGPTDYKFDKIASSLIVDRTLALSVSGLSFFSAQLSASNVLSMTVRNEMIQRAMDDGKWKAAFKAWKSDPANAYLFQDPNVTRILVVRGYALKSFTYKNYVKMEGKAGGSYGVSVAGQGYWSQDESKIEYLWGLDYAVIFAGTSINPALVKFPRDPSTSEKDSIHKILSGMQVMKRTM